MTAKRGPIELNRVADAEGVYWWLAVRQCCGHTAAYQAKTQKGALNGLERNCVSLEAWNEKFVKGGRIK